MIYNTDILRHDAHFEVKIAEDIYWVPANIIGKTRYSNLDIERMRLLSPDIKKENINNLYEALQLFQISDFVAVDDVMHISYQGENWEKYKSGYFSVLSNCGCCSSDANWLLYILDKKYSEVGIISLIRSTGTGHVFNYIYHEGWYYIVDLQIYEKSHKQFACVETGRLKDYLQGVALTKVIIKTSSLKRYAQYYEDMNRNNDIEIILFQQRNMESAPISVRKQKNRLIYVYPKTENIVCLSSGKEEDYSRIWYEKIEVSDKYLVSFEGEKDV